MNIELNIDTSLSKFYDWVITLDDSSLLDILEKINTIVKNSLEKECKGLLKPKSKCFLLYENIEQTPVLSIEEWQQQLSCYPNARDIDIYINDKYFYDLLKKLGLRVYRYYPSNDFEILNSCSRFQLSTEKIQHHFTNLSYSRHDHNYELHKFFYENNLLDKTLWSFHNSVDKYEKNYNKYLNYEEDNYKIFKERFVDGDTENSEMSETDLQHHRESAFTINKETVYNGHGPHYSEKLIKTIAAGRPFIEVSCPYTLKDLKKNMGIQTFSDIVNEDYDNIEDPFERMMAIKKEIKKLSNIPLKTLKNYIIFSQEKLKRNYEIVNEVYNTSMNYEINYDPCIFKYQ